MTTPPHPRPALRHWLRAALTPRMLVLALCFALAVVVCGLLGSWQWGRAQIRAEQRENARLEQLNAGGPAALDTVLAPQQSFTGAMLGRSVQVSGTYDRSGQLLVPGRMLGERRGYAVLTPLLVQASPSSATASPSSADDGVARLPVVRGWVQRPEDATEAPSGPVTLTGYLALSESAESAQLGESPAGQIGAISSAILVNEWGPPIYTGYLVMQTSAPASDPLARFGPPHPASGFNLQNLFYALEWWVFGLFAAVLWLRLVRDQARELARAESRVPATL